MKLGQHLIATGSTTQIPISLSSGEAEFYAMVKGASEMLGLTSIAKDLNVDLLGQIHSDSSAAIGIVHRRGLGKVKHMHTQYLWVQERVRSKDFSLHKIRTDDNTADLMTKYLIRVKIDLCMKNISQEVRQGRATSGLDVQCAQAKKTEV